MSSRLYFTLLWAAISFTWVYRCKQKWFLFELFVQLSNVFNFFFKELKVCQTRIYFDIYSDLIAKKISKSYLSCRKNTIYFLMHGQMLLKSWYKAYSYHRQ